MKNDISTYQNTQQNYETILKKAKEDLRNEGTKKIADMEVLTGSLMQTKKKAKSFEWNKKKQFSKKRIKENIRKAKLKRKRNNYMRKLTYKTKKSSEKKRERKDLKILRGDHCQWIDFTALRTKGKNCEDGSKVVIKNM